MDDPTEGGYYGGQTGGPVFKTSYSLHLSIIIYRVIEMMRHDQALANRSRQGSLR